MNTANTYIVPAKRSTKATLYYTCFVVKSDTTYDLQFYSGLSPIKTPNELSHKLAYFIDVKTTRNVPMERLTGWIRNKVKDSQVYNGKPPIATKSYITNINMPINKLVNILQTEFDYHIGEKKCLQKENKKYLTRYVNNIDAGFGPEYKWKGESSDE
jgi:hypothetical protein